MARPITSALERAYNSFVVHPLGCWEYQGTLNRGGYGVIGEGRKLKWLVHRLIYEDWFGPIPEGLTVDHLCFNARCINPAHLDVVSLAENTRRQWAAGRADPGRRQRLKTHCKRGHPFNAENTYHNQGRRHCRACHCLHGQRLRKENQ